MDENLSWADTLRALPNWHLAVLRAGFWWGRLRREIGALEKPVLVYQMGKVGSKSIEASLHSQGVHNLHVHWMNPAAIRTLSGPPSSAFHVMRSHVIRSEVLGGLGDVRVITPVREPVGRNVSSYFQNFDRISGLPTASEISAGECRDDFLQNYPHGEPVQWFDSEIDGVLGIDVFANSFPKKRGWKVLTRGQTSLLLFKCELPDSTIAHVIQEFLDLDEFEISRKNVSSQKEYGDVYSEFKRNVALPESYLDRIYDSEVARHFYSQTELRDFEEKWSG